MLIGREDALEVQCADVFRVEAQDARERDGRVTSPSAVEQRFAERRERIEVIRIALQQLDEQYERLRVAPESPPERRQRERGFSVGGYRVERCDELALGVGIEA